MSTSFCKQVGHWRLSKETIGSGTTSTVVLATHAKLPTLRAAVKVVSRSGLLIKAEGDPTALHLADAVIHREVLLMKLAAHRHVVRLYDFVGHGDLAYMVLEHAPNKTLFDLFRLSPTYLPPPLVVHIFSQIMQGLAYTHSLRIVHRDLKLENIFVYGPDVKALLRKATAAELSALTVKIGDFGLSHVDDPQTLSTVFHGSPHYQSPELWARLPHRPLPTDVWSAGVILYALQCRRLPFDLSALEDCAAVFVSNDISESESTNQAPVPIPGSQRCMAYDVPECMPQPANRLFQRIFALDPAARPTAQEILHDAYFDGLDIAAEGQNLQDNITPVIEACVELYDLATLCIPPGKHLSRTTFVGSTLEQAVKERLGSPEVDVIERRWAQRLGAYMGDKEAWETAVEVKALEKEKKNWSKSLGGRLKIAEALTQRDIHLAILKPRLTTSLSFRSLRPKTLEHTLPSHPPLTAPHPTPVSSSVAEALQGRREMLLRRAYELGFGTYDLRAFADEAGEIVRVARQGRGGMGLEEIAREIEKRTALREHEMPSPADSELMTPVSDELALYGPNYESRATTFVAENLASDGLEKGQLHSIPTVKLVTVES